MTQNNIKIAITGGIGSGKSTVADFIRQAGYPVFSCDKIYAELLTDSDFIDMLCREFGDVKLADGSLDRKKLSNVIFNSAEKRKRLDELTHPLIMSSAFGKMSGFKISFLEVPLLFENGFEKLFDGVIVVLRAEEERINAIVARDKISKNKAVLRLKSQLNYKNLSFADYYVTHNDYNLDFLKECVDTTLFLIEKSFAKPL